MSDRHYSRQSPGSKKFVPPGRSFVLYADTKDGEAAWVTSWPYEEYTKHEWAGVWVNSLFRNEGAGLSSDLIRQAVSATVWYWRNGRESWNDPMPEDGMITFIDTSEVQSENPGYCYKCAGFEHVGKTKSGKVAVQLPPGRMPEPDPPIGGQTSFV
jgi:hypothetical protein